MTIANVIEELVNVARNQPLAPGDTVSHAGASTLCRMGLIQRDSDGSGNWVLTAAGLSAYLSKGGAS